MAILSQTQEEGPVRTGKQLIPRRSQSGPCPLSFAQQRLWLLNQLEPDSPAYNQPMAIRLNGTLHIEALKKTLDAIVVRHEVFRTNFLLMEGHPVQVVGENLPVELPLIELIGIPGEQRERAMERFLVEVTQRHFDLSRDLMLRATLVRLDSADHVLFLVTHHIDGWSSRVLFQEIATIYEAFSNERSSQLLDLPIRYQDFAVWQRQWLQGNVLETQLSYWKRQLDRVPVLELPTDRPRSAIQTHRGASARIALPESLSEALKDLSRRNRVTLFMTLLAAFQTLLCRHTGQDDIPIGIPIANRTRLEIEGLIGLFANTLVLRTDLSGNPTFIELLGRVREVALRAYAHQDLPFEKLVEVLSPQRSLSYTPLVQILFVFQNWPNIH